ncbi:Clp protease-like protein [Streptococcus satellite phage Javan746]|uniref:head maturation protease, ClpP-related n=1 Tax=Streptococcus pneumoniae TaxID=1313 RepID=UPI0002314E98|nr:head maturation protease, ClpP-related [Streptococcus pneumoniae]EHD26166.1 clp protease family protein [Streptococcus pneumoniae GA47502]QBX12982.1 Clp protease-like protein [Streptococcus satellite phage Javan746]VND08151.1 Predicted clp-protease [Streptococcus pneumoniae]
MQQIKIKGAIISNDSIPMYQKAQKEYTALKDIKVPFPDKPLEVIINSGGGDVFTGSEIYSMLKNHKGHVTVKIVGVCASAASMVAMAGDTVEMSPTGLLMIHNAMGWTFGNTQEHEKQIKSLEEANDSIAKAYQNKTGLPLSEIRDLMKEETWFSCDKAIKYGFVDKEMFVNSISQSMVASVVQHLPERYHYDFIENVLKKNQHLIKREEKVTSKSANIQHGQKLMLLGTTGYTTKKTTGKQSTNQKVNIAKNAERIAEVHLLNARAKIRKAVNDAVAESMLEKQKGAYSKEAISNSYQHGDYIYKDGQTIPVAQNQQHYQDMVERVRGI